MVSFVEKVRKLWHYFGKEDAVMREFAIGMSSEVDIKSNLHILFLDYDQVSIEEVLESVGEIQEFFNLADAFIYKTRNGYHVYFFYDIMPYSRVLMIINYAKYVDDMFRYISRFYDYKTIRQAGKYKVRDIVFDRIVQGNRTPSKNELELGELKRKERQYLAGMGNMLNKDNLKE
jgi:hypothetical protein